MSGKVSADSSWSFAPVPELFRFSPHPNQAHKVQWRSWGESAFAEAIQTDKPIFLLISSLWCQGCQLMDETTLSEPRVIDVINADYIPIRVDSDLRPDINQRYNQNGWPSTLFLSGEGEILWGGVYLPPTKLLYYLGYIRRYYADHRLNIFEQVQSLQAQRRTHSKTQAPLASDRRFLYPEEKVILQDLPEGARQVMRELYDRENGGFTIHPHLKFPHADALALLLFSEQPADHEMVSYSLTQMRDGGLWDSEEGGFFRYSAAGDWSMPHTEKMLDENASMLRLLLFAARKTGDQQWKQLARQLINYIDGTLWQANTGAFSGSQCADEAYYEPGSYSRASRTRPLVDRTVYTTANAHMISAYLCAAQILEDATLQTRALSTLDYLIEHLMHQDGNMLHYAIDDRAFLPGQLADQVWMTQALLDAYVLCGTKQYLETAIALMHYTCQELLDPSSGLFYDCPLDPQAIGRLNVCEQPLLENALAATCLLRMSAYSQRQSLHDTALLVFSGSLAKYYRTGIQGATYACAVALASVEKWL